MPLHPRNLHPSPPTCRLRVMALGWHLVQMPLGQGRCPSHPDLILQLMFSRATNLPLRVTARWVWAPPGQTQGQDPSVSGAKGLPEGSLRVCLPLLVLWSHMQGHVPRHHPCPPLPVPDPGVSLKQPPDGHSEDASLGLGCWGVASSGSQSLLIEPQGLPGQPTSTQSSPGGPVTCSATVSSTAQSRVPGPRNPRTPRTCPP